MTFLPKKEIMSLEEIETVCLAFTQLGVDKIRITGGEPLVRHNVLSLIQNLSQLKNLQELLITTNGSQLSHMAGDLKDTALSRINISLDSLQADKFKQLTRTGELDKVLAGIDAAIEAGFKKIKLNAVILKGRNDNEIIDLVNYARDKCLDITFIEEMPLGHIVEHNRAEAFMASEEIRQLITQQYPLSGSDQTTGGPARYYQMADSKIKIGFISPHSDNFCSSCNRVRVTVEGRLLLCLGNEHSVDLKPILRQPTKTSDQILEELKTAIIDSMQIKPERHHFALDDEPQVIRFMNTTGG